VGVKGAEKDLAEFLAAQPSWVRKVLLRNFPLDPEESEACDNADFNDLAAREREYRAILQRIPAKWREYRAELKRIALANVPTGKAGRPRKDDIAEEAMRLKRAGKSNAGVANELNRKHGPGTTTPDAVRKLLSSRKRGGSAPDKI